MSDAVETIDLDAPRTFFGPHPGFAGAAIPIPAAVKKVADELDGQTLPLREALARLRAATTGTIEVNQRPPLTHGTIFLKLKGEGKYADGLHMFRIISFR